MPTKSLLVRLTGIDPVTRSLGILSHKNSIDTIFSIRIITPAKISIYAL